MIVSMRYCQSYQYENLRAILQETIASLGGFEPYIKPGQKILLKPNLLAKKKPEEATTTHPIFIRALASLLIEYGASVIIGDSPGGPFNSGIMNGIYKATGMEAAALATGASLNQNYGQYEAENPSGLIMKRLTLASMLKDVDAVICVAKLKTHGMMTYTGAAKNMFGIVPGIAKAEYHFNIQDYDAFADALIDICEAAKPVLSFIDGIVGMEGNGPAAGTPVETGAVLASPSPHHADMAACRLIGLATGEVPMLRRAAARGLVKADMSDIKLVGDPYESFKGCPYKAPATRGIMNITRFQIPMFVKNFLARRIQTRPHFDLSICNGCGICREACPAKIIEIKGGKATLDFKDCIRCYCCQELCPKKAITIHRPRFSRVMRL